MLPGLLWEKGQVIANSVKGIPCQQDQNLIRRLEKRGILREAQVQARHVYPAVTVAGQTWQVWLAESSATNSSIWLTTGTSLFRPHVGRQGPPPNPPLPPRIRAICATPANTLKGESSHIKSQITRETDIFSGQETNERKQSIISFLCMVIINAPGRELFTSAGTK